MDFEEIMKHSLFSRAARTAMITLAASGYIVAQEAAKEASKLTEAEIKSASSYAAGYTTGMAFAEEYNKYGVTLEDLEMEGFIKGMRAASKGRKPEIEPEKLHAAMLGLSKIVEAREKSLAEKNLKAGQEFLEKNGKREGVITNKSGLQYEVLVKGGDQKYVASTDGKPSNKLFMVNYKGTKIDGTVFDESPAGKPVTMNLQVLDGFREALTSMPVGAKWKIYLPSSLAFGAERGRGDIEPNSTLIFELELLEIKDVPAQPAFPHGLKLKGADE
jgi:FKBP-type peptidyl-prolyl cis-trans isomerase